MNKNNIIIAGFPKSGTTWACRLIAELINCPVEGFWLYPDHEEIAIEGKDRTSKYCCYKSHHTYSELGALKKSDSIIYIVRDPRDVAISSADYFKYKFGKTFTFIEKIPLMGRKIKRSLMINKYISIVLKGSPNLNKWFNYSWLEHQNTYLDKENVIIVKYEDLLLKPKQEITRILSFLKIDLKQKEINKAIENQSSENKKKMYLKKGDIKNYNFINKAKSGKWESELNFFQKLKFKNIKSRLYHF